MNVLERAGEQLSFLRSVEAAYEAKERRRHLEDGAKFVSEVLGTKISYAQLTPESDRPFSPFLLTLDGLHFRISYEHRGYDNMGGGWDWYLYVRYGIEEFPRWESVRNLIDLGRLAESPWWKFL